MRDVTDMYTVEDSGKREEYASGARRDTEDGKPRYDLISPFAMRRLAEHMRKGAEKYGDRNWEQGIPTRRLLSSALRHLYRWIIGSLSHQSQEEDHLAAVCFNVMAIMHFEERGGNPADLSQDVDYHTCPAMNCQDDCDVCEVKHKIVPKRTVKP